MGDTTRWVTDHPSGHSRWYVQHFRRMAAEGADLVGEARLVDTLVGRGSRVLDAGCGPGRIGADLARRGHEVVGVDADPVLIDAARDDHPGPVWLVGDLAHLDLAAAGHPEPFDAVVLAGNVLIFVAPDTEAIVIGRVAAHVRPDGVVVCGFRLNRGYDLAGLDRHARDAGLVLEHRFATWDLRPYVTGDDYAVSVFRRPR